MPFDFSPELPADLLPPVDPPSTPTQDEIDAIEAIVKVNRHSSLTELQLNLIANNYRTIYKEAWSDAAADPAKTVAYLKALGTKAGGVFAMSQKTAIYLSEMLTILQAFGDPENTIPILLKELQGMGIPKDWDVPFNPDGSVSKITYPTLDPIMETNNV